jgi:hypothetical protein
MTMIGLLLNPTKADFSPEALSALEAAMQARARIRTKPAAGQPAPPTRLKRLINGWIAAALAYRERQAAWLAAHEAGERDLTTERIYRGPLDDAFERAARRRAQQRFEQS